MIEDDNNCLTKLSKSKDAIITSQNKINELYKREKCLLSFLTIMGAFFWKDPDQDF